MKNCKIFAKRKFYKYFLLKKPLGCDFWFSNLSYIVHPVILGMPSTANNLRLTVIRKVLKSILETLSVLSFSFLISPISRYSLKTTEDKSTDLVKQ